MKQEDGTFKKLDFEATVTGRFLEDHKTFQSQFMCPSGFFKSARPTYNTNTKQWKALFLNANSQRWRLTDVFIQEGGKDLEPYPGRQNRIFIQKANGTFADETESRLPIYNDFSHGTAFGDIDNGGDLDIQLIFAA